MMTNNINKANKSDWQITHETKEHPKEESKIYKKSGNIGQSVQHHNLET